VPFVVFTLLVQPTLLYALYHPLGVAPESFWREFLGSERQLDTGPLWFAGVLLIFSLAYAGWVPCARIARPTAPPARSRHDICC
jgi:hypothetical protein